MIGQGGLLRSFSFARLIRGSGYTCGNTINLTVASNVQMW